MTRKFTKYTEFIYPALYMLNTLLFFLSTPTIAQKKPQRPIAIYVSPIQQLNFGSFTHGNIGGTVTITPEGNRTSTGDIFLLNTGESYSQALFEIEANPGTMISIINGPQVTLTGSNGGTLTMEIGSSDPISPFIIKTHYPKRTFLYIGGILFVGSPLANPEGSYSGTFMITFIQE